MVEGFGKAPINRSALIPPGSPSTAEAPRSRSGGSAFHATDEPASSDTAAIKRLDPR